MKTVVLVRHAKSVPYGYDDDFNRPLTERGELDADKISRHVKLQGIIPDRIMSSAANRALTTARIFASNLEYNKEDIVILEDMYDGLTTHEFLELLQGLPDELETVFVFGHNPTVFYLASNLVKFFNNEMPTCSTVGIEFKVDNWTEIEARQGNLAFQYIPRMFK